MDLTHGSLFSGRGGFDEGAAAAGFENKWNSEINRYCNRYLKKRFPNAIQYADITKIQAVEKVSVISAGFPCQDISVATGNKSEGIFGAKSSLFFESIRIIGSARPWYAVFENSTATRQRGLHYIITALAKIGYMCEWQCLRASDFNYPHKRERIYIIAYPMRVRHKNVVFRPIESVELYAAPWSQTEAYKLVSDCRLKPEAIPAAIPANDVVPGFSNEIHSLGNAVMPVIAEYLFQCIKLHMLI